MSGATTLNVQKGITSGPCSLTHRFASIVFSAMQTILAVVIGVLYQVKLERCVIVNIVFGIHLTCAAVAASFLVFCAVQRKFGTFYEVLLHGYLLSILLMGLTSMFGVMYVPLSFIQASHSFAEGVDHLLVFFSTMAMFGLQFVQRNLTEQMLPVMEHTFK